MKGTPESSLCTFLGVSRTRNHPTGYISKILVSPIQVNDNVPPHPRQVRHHLGAEVSPEHPLLFDYASLTGIEFEFDAKTTVSVHLDTPKAFQTFLTREHEAWQTKRDADLQELHRYSMTASDKVLQKLDAGIPVAYIAGQKEFCGTSFAVSPAVMIPKIGTEVLVKAAVSRVMSSRTSSARSHVLDLGTGSGCLLLSILKQCPRAIGLGIDISPGALQIAQSNSRVLASPSNAHFMEASFTTLANHLLSTYAAHLLAAQHTKTRGCVIPFDCIVTNPPYLARGLWDSNRIYAQQRHEPRMAVVGGEEGTEAYVQIREGLAQCMEGGWVQAGRTVLFVEVNNSELAGAVRRIFEAEGSTEEPRWRYVRCEVDGKGMDRCVVFEYKQ
ncbi:S-adenosyl-L-methionine-dependent methyltransferase [Chytriomyces sp. MP71]|nr:S-adenosyl-L-methionine-dependent methyltransferase [Chytriomyces sp. MP71]